MWSERPEMGSERPDFGFEMPNFGFERPDLGSERLDLGSKRPDLGSERTNLRRGGGEIDETPDQKNCPVWNHRSSTPPGPLPKRGPTDRRTNIAGCSRVARN